jgi:hypothetical protein
MISSKFQDAFLAETGDVLGKDRGKLAGGVGHGA